MRSLIRQPDDKRDRYTALRLGCISYCTEEHGPGCHRACWQITLEQVLEEWDDTDD